MKVTYPQMGYLHIPIDGMFQRLGVDVVPTPPVSRKTLELGLLYAPKAYAFLIKSIWEIFSKGSNKGPIP